ncbi:hypothetical protein [Kribbella sp. NPDC048915]|uniref:hypothetical protein n=1 Tax=Kribbella sp. NPDC048915 TaxID=3155148 RepID=UPI0033E7B8E5
MIFTRRFGALAARPQFPDAPELQELHRPLDLDAELAELTAQNAAQNTAQNTAQTKEQNDDRESAA